MNQNEGNPPSSEVIFDSENRKFLSDIFSHPKCQHFTDEEKKKIYNAFVLSLWAHRHQERDGGEKYIEHIKRTVLGYLEITKKKSVTASDVIVAILHDVVEDHPKYLERIHERKGRGITQRVLSISKPSVAIMQVTFGHIVQAILTQPESILVKGHSYFLQKFSPGPAEELQSHTKLYIHLVEKLPLRKSSWDDFKNYQFFWMIADLPEDDFEIKCADRRDNLGDLKGVNLNYIEKNIISTEVYILKAEALGRHDLADILHDGINNLLARKREITGIGL